MTDTKTKTNIYLYHGLVYLKKIEKKNMTNILMVYLFYIHISRRHFI